MARSRVEPLVGDPAHIAALEAAEARLGVQFPEAYRRFIADRPRYHVTVKRMSFYPIDRCMWTDDDAAVIIGKAIIDGVTPLVFKLVRGRLSEAVYEHHGAAFKRCPRFAEFVDRERDEIAPSTDARRLFAERLAGGTRHCRCGQEIRIGQFCACGQLGKPTDPRIELDAATQAHAITTHPMVWRAWQLVRSLRDAGHAVPSGPSALLATADALAAPTDAARVDAIMAAWTATSMKLSIDRTMLLTALTA